jgi:uncharacterized protein YjiS (DUF1127 family)
MSVASITARPNVFRETLGPQSNPMHPLLEAFSSWRCRSRQRAELRARSDLELNDIGVCRCEIERIVSS